MHQFLCFRGFSTFHALAAAAVSFYLLLLSDLFSEDARGGIIVDRKSWLSDGMFGVSSFYFTPKIHVKYLFRNTVRNTVIDVCQPTVLISPYRSPLATS